jgi:hypothetical protein
MLHYPLCPPRQTCPILKLKPTKLHGSLSRSNTSSNRFRIFYISPMASTSSCMINIGCHTSFRWDIKFGCIFIKNALRGPIESFPQSAINITPSPRSWATMLLSLTFAPSLVFTQYLMWTSFGHIFHHYWTPQR